MLEVLLHFLHTGGGAGQGRGGDRTGGRGTGQGWGGDRTGQDKTGQDRTGHIIIIVVMMNNDNNDYYYYSRMLCEGSPLFFYALWGPVTQPGVFQGALRLSRQSWGRVGADHRMSPIASPR